MKSLLFLSLAIVLALGISYPKAAYAWGSSHLNDPAHPDSAHYFIIDKAIEYIREQGMALDWPLSRYANDIKYGAHWADFPYDPVGLVCNWMDMYEGTCEGIHHYYSTDCIRTPEAFNVCNSETGGLAAPGYAETLFDLAVKFWPGGEPIPDIHDLPYLSSGGRIIDMEEFGPFVVGAHPFAFDIVCMEAPEEQYFCFVEDAYRWPGFVGKEQGFVSKEDFLSEDYLNMTPSESIHSSLIYLGWAIHLIEDLSTIVHARNEAGGYHEEFESRAGDLVDNGEMSHLPVAPGANYSFVVEAGPDFPASPNFFNNDWDMHRFAQEAAERAIAAELYPGYEVLGVPLDGQIEVDLDTSIKIVAGIINKFFSQLELEHDSFEPNDVPLAAKPVSNGRYDNLTIHAPLDTDFYEITVPEEHSEVRIVVNDSGPGNLAVNIEYQDCQGEGCPSILAPCRVIDNGWIYEELNVPAGRRYLIEVCGFSDLPVNYSLDVFTGKGDLPPDKYEDNNTSDTATEWYPAGCDYTGDINIHNSSDIDWYQIDGSGYSVKAEISFDPTQGELQLFLDGVEATDSTLSDDGTEKTLSITGCGQSPSKVRVQGKRNYYDLCITKVPLQESCRGEYVTWVPLRGSGTFTYTDQICGPGEPGEHTAAVRDTMYATITTSSPDSVLWSVAVWLDITDEAYFPTVVELQCPRVSEPIPAQVTVKILSPDLTKITWFGSAPGEVFGPDSPDAITGFSGTVNLTSILYPWCVEPGHGTLIIRGDTDSDNDGILDQVEIDTGTDPYSDDTDGDGLPDGTEDANQNGQVDPGETDPRLWDSDGDSVSDGVERGLTSPNGHDTDPNLFKPDLDPATTTDPTRADTDGDGRSDGEEDVNKNGRVDAGETSPLIPDKFIEIANAYVSTTGNDFTGNGTITSPWRTIQYSVNHIANGGTIHVAAGNYNENIVVQNKAAILLGGYFTDFSTRDSIAHITTIDGCGKDRVIRMLWANGSTIDGFEIISGNTTGNGGGIFIEESDVTVTNNNIQNNTATLGAGICTYDSTHCTVENNSIHHNNGLSAVHLFVDFSTLRNNEIWENQSGGITLYEGGPPVIEENIIRDNNGDGISVGEGEADITGNQITGNSGDGIVGFLHGGKIEGNTILDNYGWGIQCHRGDILNNFVAKNKSGGIWALFDAVIVNNTIADNEIGGGVIVEPIEQPILVNNIIWGNTPQDLPDGNATFSDIGTGNTVGVGNISLDPEITGDYHLKPISPCINTGNDVAVPSWLTIDIDGEPRISGTVDMGADEYIPNTLTGTSITVTDPDTGVEVIFTEVTGAGQTTCVVSNQPPGPDPSGFELNGMYCYITTTATYTGPITVVMAYDDTGMTLSEEQGLKLMHYESGAWRDVTVGVDTTNNKVTGQVTSLSGFGVFERKPTQWSFIGGIIGVVVLLSLIVFFLIRRRRVA